jgi:tRNA A-37 threonylcarbamoyl transferase component Bud32
VDNIVSCPNCGAVVLPRESGGFCPQCRTPLGESVDQTRLADDSSGARKTSTTSSGVRHGTSSSGWLSSSGAIDHGRFQPGTLLGGRYRVVGRLGRGGMGEVYRADDLKLGQPVALKFLPAEVDRDPAKLMQLHTEVRMARQVAHPNVCRVYDIDEVDGHTFLSMEYIDGEDLSALLKRVGRFPSDRGLEIARQICAGLAAAHERGIIHRDFKPANVMLDGSGKVRITDFGLAGISGEAIRAGTPAYMAPEQLAGSEVTARSDIYSLGLVLYEIFTGQRALEGKNLAELINKREQAAFVPPSAIVKDLEPEIERTILRCLQLSPTARPASALAVAAALPGGDPLAAALAAGETPSPEMVAAAGSRDAISLPLAIAGALWVGISLVALLLLYQRVMLVNIIPTPKSPEALLDRAREAQEKLGYGPGFDRAHGLSFSLDYPRYIASTSAAPDRFKRLKTGGPPTLVLWYRTSPRLLVPLGDENNVSGQNPPLNVGDMTILGVDASGRLSEFHAVPQPLEAKTSYPPANWTALFEAAGFTMDGFAEVPSQMVPVVYANERKAWNGMLQGAGTDDVIRVEAAAQAGRPVFFALVGPWTQSARAPASAPPLFQFVIANVAALVMPALMLAGVVLARHNVKLGRGDRRGAFRAASILFVLNLVGWLFGASHVGVLGPDTQRFFGAVGGGLFNSALLWLTYLGLEPYVRKYSPDSLMGWTRAIGGQWRDSRVATDVLIGVSAGLAMTVLYGLHNVLPPMWGLPEPMPIVSNTRALLGPRFVVGGIVGSIGNALSQGMLGVVGIVALLMVLKRAWLAAPIGVLIYTPVVIANMFPAGTPRLDLAIGAGIISILIGVIIRFGLLASIAALATHFILLRAPLTTDLSTWRGSLALWYLGFFVLVGFGAAYVARSATLPRLENVSRVTAS